MADSSNITAVQRYIVYVLDVNEAPVLNNFTYQVVGTQTVGYVFSPPLSAVDPEGATAITYTVDPADLNQFNMIGNNLTVAVTDLTVSRLVTVIVSDPDGLFSAGYINVKVLPPVGASISGISPPARVRTSGGDRITFGIAGLVNYVLPITAVYSNGVLTLGSNCTIVDAESMYCVTQPVGVCTRECVLNVGC